MKALGNILNNEMSKRGLKNVFSRAVVVQQLKKAMERVMGASVMAGIPAVYIREGELVIQCEGAALAQEVLLRKSQIMAELKKTVGPAADEIKKVVIMGN